MANWYSKELGDGIEAHKPTKEIQDAFHILSMIERCSSDAAVFSQDDSEANMITVYFTPSAELLAKRFRAVPCKKPIPKKGFGLSVGDARAMKVHFPEYFYAGKIFLNII